MDVLDENLITSSCRYDTISRIKYKILLDISVSSVLKRPATDIGDSSKGK